MDQSPKHKELPKFSFVLIAIVIGALVGAAVYQGSLHGYLPLGKNLPKLPSNERDEGGSPATTEGTCSTQPTGNQGLPNSSGEAQGQQQPPTHSPVAQQEDECPTEVLRLRVQVRKTKTHKVEYVWVPINMLI